MSKRADSPDILYMVKQSEENDELKYSIRSLKNFNYRNIFLVAGYIPTWLTDKCIHIPVEQNRREIRQCISKLD